jgi:hypothetical protein
MTASGAASAPIATVLIAGSPTIVSVALYGFPAFGTDCPKTRLWGFMRGRIFILSIAFLGPLISAENLPLKKGDVMTTTNPYPRMRAHARIIVRHSEAEPYDQTAGPALKELRLDETFSGDINGESPVRALQVLRDDKSASLVSLQRFRGKLGEREGSFVLQGSEVVENGKIKAAWFVVPGTGTGELSGLRGEGGFEGEFGKGSVGTLDYWFE